MFFFLIFLISNKYAFACTLSFGALAMLTLHPTCSEGSSACHTIIVGFVWTVRLTNIFQVICEKVEKSDIATIDKKKYLVPSDLTVGQFVYVIRKRIKLSPEKAIFIFVDEVLPPTAALMSSIYEEHKDEDGYATIFYIPQPFLASLTYGVQIPLHHVLWREHVRILLR